MANDHRGGDKRPLHIPHVCGWRISLRNTIQTLFQPTTSRIRPEIKNQLVPVTTPLIGFSDEIIWPIGSVNSSWNVKAPGGRRIHYSKKQQVGFAGMCVGLRTRRGPRALKPMVEERVKVAINPEYPEQTVMIGSTLTDEGRNKLCDLLQRTHIFGMCQEDIVVANLASFVGAH
ncbi:hypothetical protein Tco_1242541 [Tanacetum coccineum]